MLTALLARLARRVVRRPAGRSAAAHAADIEDFLATARASFVRLQAAWDAADVSALEALTTSQLLAELREQLVARGPALNTTEVVSLDARLLSLEELQEAFVACVEFSGLIRERLNDGAAPFRELWMLARLKASDQSTQRDWQLARVQALG